MEIERKFIITDLNKVREITEHYPKQEITQDYLYADHYTAIRKRKISTESNTTYIYTIKTMKTGFSVHEIEKEITKQDYDALPLNPNYYTLTKDRYKIPYLENLTIEVDIFHGIYEGIVFAEIEFENETQANQVILPEWFGKDISLSISNGRMAVQNMREEIESLRL